MRMPSPQPTPIHVSGGCKTSPPVSHDVTHVQWGAIYKTSEVTAGYQIQDGSTGDPQKLRRISNGQDSAGLYGLANTVFFFKSTATVFVDIDF